MFSGFILWFVCLWFRSVGSSLCGFFKSLFVKNEMLVWRRWGEFSLQVGAHSHRRGRKKKEDVWAQNPDFLKTSSTLQANVQALNLNLQNDSMVSATVLFFIDSVRGGFFSSNASLTVRFGPKKGAFGPSNRSNPTKCEDVWDSSVFGGSGGVGL